MNATIPPDAKTWLTAALVTASQQQYDVQTCLEKAGELLEAWQNAAPIPGLEPSVNATTEPQPANDEREK